ncbi:MAG: 6,7-dimethyl-8-ribityllumazine synthase [Gaiellaceae bacterium]|nr:6,7-dimethyl-8-ribityllumazine synthase [Gaiellaceae bacterium]
MSHSESWPGEPSDLSEVEDEDELEEPADDDEDTGDEPALDDDEPNDDEEPDDDEPSLRLAGSSGGELDVPDDVELLEGEARGARRGVGIVVSRSNAEITNRLLESALAELEQIGVARDQITVMAVPGAFELPLGAMALAKTRRYACIVALGCVIRGETARFEYISGEAASGLQLAALETGVPVSFGVLTVDTLEQATARVASGAAAVRTALEMADLFQQLRSTAQAAK